MGRTAAAEAPSSAVYLTYPDGTAALILRSVNPRAMSLGNTASGAAGESARTACTWWRAR